MTTTRPSPRAPARILVVVGLAHALGVGCGDNVVAQGVTQSGARIRAQYFVDDAGDRIPRGWFDRELGVECTWMGGDHPPCLPSYALTSDFADPGCTTPVARVFPPDNCTSSPRPSYLAVYGDACDESVVADVWTVADEVVLDATTYRRDGPSGTCRAVAVEPGATYYRAGRRLGPRDLAHGHVELVGRGRIRTRTIVGDDGTLIPRDAFDVDLNASCYLDEVSGCLPLSSNTSFSEGDQCARPVAVVSTRCSAPTFISVGASAHATIYRMGELLSSDPAAEVAGSRIVYDPVTFEAVGCAADTLSPWDGVALHRSGEVIDDIEAVRREVDGGAAISAVWRVAGLHRELVEHIDRATGVACHSAQIAGEGWRCLPHLNVVVRLPLFEDAECERPVKVAINFDPKVEGLPAVETDPDGCGHIVRAFLSGAVRPTGTTYIRIGDRPCEPVPTMSMGRPLRLVSVGEATSLDQFQRLTPTID